MVKGTVLLRIRSRETWIQRRQKPAKLLGLGKQMEYELTKCEQDAAELSAVGHRRN